MARRRRLLLLPVLLPLLTALVLGGLNPSPPTRLRLLVWQTPAWPLGAWLAFASGAGGLLASGGVLLVGAPSSPRFRRRIHRPLGPQEEEPWPTAEDAEPRRPSSNRTEPGGRAETATQDHGSPWQGPARASGQPPPTVAVPFRVIRRAHLHAAEERRPQPQPPTGVGGNDWAEERAEDW